MVIKSCSGRSYRNHRYDSSFTLSFITKYFVSFATAALLALTVSGCSVSAGGMIVFGDGIYVGASGGSS